MRSCRKLRKPARLFGLLGSFLASRCLWREGCSFSQGAVMGEKCVLNHSRKKAQGQLLVYNPQNYLEIDSLCLVYIVILYSSNI